MKKIKSISFMCFFILLTFFINSNKINATTCASITDITAYRTCLTSLGFPDSYLDKLVALHATYPNWEFQAVNTGLGWNDSVNMESNVPSTLLSYSRIDGRPIGGNVGYRSTDQRVYNWATDTWIAIESGVWYAANKEVVSYYMDPRNFLTIEKIFMFQELSYNSSYQTEAIVDVVLPTGDYYNLDDYSSYFITAASTYNVNPIHLASRVRQEGAYNTISASGQNISCTSDKLNAWYGYNTFQGSSFYNLYNIYAVGSVPTCSAVAWASNGYNYLNGSYLGDGTYGRPWNTIGKSIIGGAQFLAESYISIGQDTLYAQKFDYVGYPYSHQYMTNIQAVSSEGTSEYNAYNNMGIITESSTFSFKIPVYGIVNSETGVITDAIPATATTLPVNKNPNSYLKSLTIDGENITGFAYNKTAYTLLVSTSTNSITIDGTPVNSEAIVTNEGVINLPNLTNTINVIGTAANGNTTTYTLTVIKSDEVPITPNAAINNMNLKLNSTYVSGITIGTTASTLLTLASSTSPFVSAVVRNQSGTETTSTVGTGYTITINNTLTSNTYSIVQKGDTNGDADISIKDLLIVQKHLLKSTTLNGAYYQGADIDNDGNVSIKDLLIVQKHLLGITPITQ